MHIKSNSNGGQLIDMSAAVIITPRDQGRRENNAIGMLLDEVEKRSGLRWIILPKWPTEEIPVICITLADSLPEISVGQAKGLADSAEAGSPEGYQIQIRNKEKQKIVYIIGNDERGVLFGIGRLLRELRMRSGKILLPENFNETSAPFYSLRGHQLGYRPKTNSYCAWDLPQWEQYIRDLVIFGTNAIELIPPRSDDIPDCPHFPLPQLEMMIGMSKLADDYGIDVWIWYPAMDEDYGDQATVEFALREWGEVFRALPRIDAVFVPGGDPGHTHPNHLMALLERQTENVRKFHPKAQMWVSPQGFTDEWFDIWIRMMNGEEHDWLEGVVYAPQSRNSIEEFRKLIPEKYPIRHYPDITHCLRCQYPPAEWHWAFALTEGREPINPRPVDQAKIFKQVQPHSFGFLTYSEGCNDDVNKFIWSSLGWNPEESPEKTLRQYSRYFIGEEVEEEFTKGLFSLEKNWKGPITENNGIVEALKLFQKLEKTATESRQNNWRFQQVLYRAYYDAYIQRRLKFEMELENEALAELNQVGQVGSLAAIQNAEIILDRPLEDPVTLSCRKKVFALANALFKSIGMQLSVKRYQAVEIHRGANLDGIDFPLNNGLWMKANFARIRQLEAETDRLKEIREIVEWADPGPGGFYDDLGDPRSEPHLVRGPGFESDPSFLQSALDGCEVVTDLNHPSGKPVDGQRTSWRRRAQTFYETPLTMKYDDIDPNAKYRVRVVYGADLEKPFPQISLTAGKNSVVHPLIDRPVPFRPLEFDIPADAIIDDSLTLNWRAKPGFGGNGHGVHVAEVWILKESSE